MKGMGWAGWTQLSQYSQRHGKAVVQQIGIQQLLQGLSFLSRILLAEG